MSTTLAMRPGTPARQRPVPYREPAVHRRPAVQAAVVATLARSPRSAGWHGSRTLSAREIQVLRLISFGATNQQVARELVVTPTTVLAHTRRIFTKLDTANRAAAVAEGFRLGYLKPRPHRPEASAADLGEELAEVLSLVAAGYTNEQIGAETGYTLDAIKHRVKVLLRTLCARSREHAVRLAIEAGLLRPGSARAADDSPREAA